MNVRICACTRERERGREREGVGERERKRERGREVGARMNEWCTTKMELMSGINIESLSLSLSRARARALFIFLSALFYSRPLSAPLPACCRARLVACAIAYPCSYDRKIEAEEAWRHDRSNRTSRPLLSVYFFKYLIESRARSLWSEFISRVN